MNKLFIVATATRSPVGPLLITLVVIGFYVFIFALIIIALIRIARYFKNAGKEQKLIRLELGKVAEEVHQLRQELKDGKGSNTLTIN